MESNPFKCCPRCGNPGCFKDLCLMCGWPGLKQRADACRHVELRVRYDKKIECLNPSCVAVFKEHPKKPQVVELKSGDLLKRCPDNPLLEVNPKLKVEPGDELTFWAIRYDKLNQALSLCSPLLLDNPDKVSVPASGWGWVKPFFFSPNYTVVGVHVGRLGSSSENIQKITKQESRILNESWAELCPK
jgi:hypothetical protein